jgi:hypothetical protein
VDPETKQKALNKALNAWNRIDPESGKKLAKRSICKRANNSDYLPIVSIIATIGKNKAITINPTATARNTIITGSIKEVMPCYCIVNISS